MTDAVLEAVIRELETARPLFFPYDVELLATSILAAVTPLIEAAALERAAEEAAATALTAVTPLIRAAALEEAAKVAEGFLWKGDPNWVATAIRALKEQP
jgi:hypothetical protein